MITFHWSPSQPLCTQWPVESAAVVSSFLDVQGQEISACNVKRLSGHGTDSKNTKTTTPLNLILCLQQTNDIFILLNPHVWTRWK